MWGFFAALISGALMSIQGVFNTEVTRTEQPVGIYRLGTSFRPLQSVFWRGFLRGDRVLRHCGR